MEEVRLKPRFKYRHWVNADYCLRQRVPDGAEQRKAHLTKSVPLNGLSSSGTAVLADGFTLCLLCSLIVKIINENSIQWNGFPSHCHWFP